MITIQSHAKRKNHCESCLREGAVVLEFHVAGSNIKMQRKRNRDWVLKSYKTITANDGNGNTNIKKIHVNRRKVTR